MEPVKVLYQDQYLAALYKPPGLHVHPSALDKDPDSLMKRLSKQLGCWVYPVHRLDRATAGLVLMALDQDTNRRLSVAFQERQIEKEYQAVTRGWLADSGWMRHWVKAREETKRKEALCAYRCLARTELPYPVRPYATARYSRVLLKPETGRRHQLRLQLKKINHPIVGDANYGDIKHNQFLKAQFGWARLGLFATGLKLDHPITGKRLELSCPLDAGALALMADLGLALEREVQLGQDRGLYS